MQFIDVPPDDVQPGDLALHVSGQLDSRKVMAVIGDELIYLDIFGQRHGPLHKRNYTYRRRVTP